jgi:hypothetical protein
MTATIALTILIILTFAFATRVFAQPQAQPSELKAASSASQSPSSVIGSFEAALNSHDSTAALALIADGAVVSDLSNIACLPGQPPFCQGYNVFTTKTQIRGWVEQLVKINVQLKETGAFQERGNNVTWTLEVTVDEYRRLAVAPLDANASAVIQDEKITSLTIVLTGESTSKLAVAYARNRASPYAVMAGGIGFGIIFLGLVFPAAGVYYVSRVKRLFATVPRLHKPWILLGAGVGSLFITMILVTLRDVVGLSTSIVDPIFSVVLVICAFLVMLAMILMKRVMIGEPDD